jgi:excinuclease ABC subunit B
VFRVRGDTLEVLPAYDDTRAFRISFFGDEVERIITVNPLTGEVFDTPDVVEIYPAKHYITEEERMAQALVQIEAELEVRLAELRGGESAPRSPTPRTAHTLRPRDAARGRLLLGD